MLGVLAIYRGGAPSVTTKPSVTTARLSQTSLGLLQMKLGKLAEEKGSSASVRDFGKRTRQGLPASFASSARTASTAGRSAGSGSDRSAR
jgi:hypothetical protein